MAKMRKAKRKGPTGGLADILKQASTAYADAEPMGVAPFIPEVGKYKAHLSDFATEQRESREGGPDYLFIRLTCTLDEEPYDGRETSITFNSLVTGQAKKDKDIWSLKRFKGLSSVLNEGEAIEDLESAIDFVKSCAEEQVPVILVIDEYTARDGSQRRSANIAEVDLSAVATTDDDEPEDEPEDDDDDEDDDEPEDGSDK